MHHQLQLAVNGREHQLHRRLVAFDPLDGDVDATRGGTVAIVGLGYVGLPTALALHNRYGRIIGLDNSEHRLRVIEAGTADLAAADQERLAAARADHSLRLTTDAHELADADAVIVCVPTPVDDAHVPDLTALRSACATVVEHARPGQTIILTSTSFVGTTTELIAEPLLAKGSRIGEDIFVAFSPERIDPGNPDHVQRETPRVVGGVTPECSRQAARVLRRLTDRVYQLSSPEAAEATKLYENIFRAVSLALANEFADICQALDLDPIEVTLAAGTKPYGFLGAFPGPGVGGHCIPCDPYYLLWQLTGRDTATPLIEQTMRSIALRPEQVVRRVCELLDASNVDIGGARVLVVGVSYKAGVSDLRESSALPIITRLTELGAHVAYHDPLVPAVTLPNGTVVHTTEAPAGKDWDLAVIHTVHPGVDYAWAADCPTVLDATYQFDVAPHRVVV